jgi:hypothetical protein
MDKFRKVYCKYNHHNKTVKSELGLLDWSKAEPFKKIMYTYLITAMKRLRQERPDCKRIINFTISLKMEAVTFSRIPPILCET